MKYTYRIYREVWLDVDVEADNEDEAQLRFEEIEESGELNDDFRDFVLEEDTVVAEVWEGGVENGLCIYSYM